MKHSLSIRRPHIKSKRAFSWAFDAAATTVFIPYNAKLLPTELIKINCVQCQYHRHGPLELMNQMISGVSCSTQRVICSWTNTESCDLLFGGTVEASFKGSSVTWFCYLVLADNYSICSLIFHISSFSRSLALVPVFLFLLSLSCIFFSPPLVHFHFLSTQKITYSDSLVHRLPCSKSFLHHTSVNKGSTFVSLLVWW